MAQPVQPSPSSRLPSSHSSSDATAPSPQSREQACSSSWQASPDSHGEPPATQTAPAHSSSPSQKTRSEQEVPSGSSLGSHSPLPSQASGFVHGPSRRSPHTLPSSAWFGR